MNKWDRRDVLKSLREVEAFLATLPQTAALREGREYPLFVYEMRDNLRRDATLVEEDRLPRKIRSGRIAK